MFGERVTVTSGLNHFAEAIKGHFSAAECLMALNPARLFVRLNKRFIIIGVWQPTIVADCQPDTVLGDTATDTHTQIHARR